MKETVLLELERKTLIEVLQIAERENKAFSNFISEIIENHISNQGNNAPQYENVQEPSIIDRDLSLLFKNRENFHEVIEQYEKDLIFQALEQTGGIKARAAELLKMNRTTLVEKIKKLKLE